MYDIPFIPKRLQYVTFVSNTTDNWRLLHSTMLLSSSRRSFGVPTPRGARYWATCPAAWATWACATWAWAWAWSCASAPTAPPETQRCSTASRPRPRSPTGQWVGVHWILSTLKCMQNVQSLNEVIWILSESIVNMEYIVSLGSIIIIYLISSPRRPAAGDGRGAARWWKWRRWRSAGAGAGGRHERPCSPPPSPSAWWWPSGASRATQGIHSGGS